MPLKLILSASELGYHLQVILVGRAIDGYIPRDVAHVETRELDDAGEGNQESQSVSNGLNLQRECN